ncbi:MAG: BLUF domain-containing protein [Planctomycetota bacterium]
MALTQLLYTSKTVDALGLDDLLVIQEQSIRNNARVNITGALFHCEGRFVQFLEGEHHVVHEMYETISRDPRHKDIKLLYKRPAASRLFVDWHMAMLDLDLHSDEERADLQALVDYANYPVELKTGTPMDLLILQRFGRMLIG